MLLSLLQHTMLMIQQGMRRWICIILTLAAVSMLGAYPLRAQTYLTNIGVPSFTTQLPIENGFVNVANGNLHLEIPLGSYPQRGGGVDKIALMYDSAIYFNASGYWSPTNFASYGGWRLVTSGDVGTITNGEYDYGWCNQADDYEYARFGPWIWAGPDGTQHTFSVNIVEPEYPGICGGSGTPNGSRYASDGSGFLISITNYGDPNYGGDVTVYAPDGTKIDLTNSVKTDPNGNQYTVGAVLQDTLGRNIVQETSGTNTVTYSVPNALGGTSSYILHLSTIYYNSAFGSGYNVSGSFQAPTEIDLPDATSYLLSYDTGTSSGHYGLLSSMTLPTGGTINYFFNNFTDAAGNVGRWITSRQTPDGTTGYSGPTFVSSCASGQFNCQQAVTITKPSNDKQVYTFTLNGGAWPINVQYEDASSTTLASTSACYNFVTLSSGTCSYPLTTTEASNVYRTAETTTLTVPGGSVSTTREYTWDPSNIGNVTQISEWNFGNAPSNAADRTIDISYYSNGHVVNRPLTVSVNGGAVANTTYSYDESGSVSSACTSSGCGDLTTVERYIDGSNHLDTHYQYDGYGNRTSIVDPAGNATSYAYDTTNAYVNQITFPSTSGVTHKEFPTFDPNTGLLASYQGQNSDTTTYSYDSMGRPIQTTFPDGGWTKTQYPTATVIDTGVGITSTTPSISCPTTGNACRHDQTVLDGLGRSSSQTLVSDPDGQDTVSTLYDGNGRITSISNPHRSISLDTDGSIGPGYDGLDRIVQIQAQDLGHSYTYYGVAVTGGGVGGTGSQACTTGVGYPILKVDEAGKKLQSWVDAFGRTIEVDEPTSIGSLTQVTCYTYDLNDNLTSTLSVGNHQNRAYTYDFISRLTSAQTPESNTTNFYYTSSGGGLCSGIPSEVCRRTDARNITTTYMYDALGRLTNMSYSDGITPTAYYYYDQTTGWGYTLHNTIGRLTADGTYLGSTNFTLGLHSYDSMGRDVLNGQSYPPTTGFVVEHAYNLDGSLKWELVDNAPWGTISYSYDAAERATSITGTLNDSQHPGTLVSVDPSIGYYPTGATRKVALGNGLTESRAYESRLQPCRIGVNNGANYFTHCGDSILGGNLQDLHLVLGVWGSTNNGNVTEWLGVGAQNFDRSYTYDNLNRITSMSDSVSTNPCTGLSWSYDLWGNRSQTPVSGTSCGTWTPWYDWNNHVYLNGGTAYVYDAAGNLTYDGSHTYYYDGENRLIQIDGTLGTCSAPTTACYVYDAEGRRGERTVSGVTTYYALNAASRVAAEVTMPNWTNGYVYFNGQLKAIYDNLANTTRFVHQDHLGTTRLLTDVSGCIVDNLDYTPFGELYVGTPLCTAADTTHKFTGQERDNESNLDNFIARYYSSAQGRFMSPDPLAGDIGDPQTLNRYAYVHNNPLTFSDPTGMQPDDGGGCDPSEGCISIGGAGICLLFCGGNTRMPPIYSPPDPGNNPNPGAGAGNPDPNGPFSGPIWQEGGPQIQPTGNLAALFGLQMPNPFIFDNTEQGAVSRATGALGLLSCAIETSDKLTISNGIAHLVSPSAFAPGTWSRTLLDTAGGGNAVNGILSTGIAVFSNSSTGKQLGQAAVGVMADPSMGLNPVIRAASGGEGVAAAIEAGTDVAAEGASGIGLLKLGYDALTTLGSFGYCALKSHP